MKRLLTLSLLSVLLVTSIVAEAQVMGSPDVVRMTKAKNRFSEGDFGGALEVYLQLYSAHGTNPLLNYRMAECYLAMNNGQDALAYLDKARELDPGVDEELDYSMAVAYRMVGKQEQAIEHVNTYLAQEKLKKADAQKAQELLAQCNTTLELIANPVNVTISGAGANVNTDDHHEYHPSITADGSIMVFTSRRPAGKFIDKDPYDGDYYEKVFITYWSDSLNGWAPAAPIPGGINDGGRHDAATSISPDGKQIFLYRNESGGDIFISKTRTNKGASDAIAAGASNANMLVSLNRWGSPNSVGKPINTSYWESYGPRQR